MFDTQISQILHLGIKFIIFFGVMISLILISTFIKILIEMSKLKDERKAYQLIQEEEELEIKHKKFIISKDKELLRNKYSPNKNIQCDRK